MEIEKIIMDSPANLRTLTPTLSQGEREKDLYKPVTSFTE
jgi:hypothetical protein